MTSSKFVAGTSIGTPAFPRSPDKMGRKYRDAGRWRLYVRRSYPSWAGRRIRRGADGRPLPGTQVGRLIEMLEPGEDEA